MVANSLWNFATFAASALLGFFSVRLFIQHLGLSQYGLLALLNTLIAPLGLLNFGLGQATVKFVAENLGRGDAAAAARHLQNTLLFNLVVGVVGATIMVLSAGVLSRDVFKVAAEDQALLSTAIHWTAVTWVVTQVSLTFTAVPTAQQNYRVVSMGTMLFSTMSMAFSLLVLVFGGGLVDVVKVRFVWSLCGLVGWAWCARVSLPEASLWPAYDRAAFRQGFGFGVWQTLAQVGGIFANQADRFLLGAYISTDAVGLFNVPTIFFVTSYSAVSKLSETLFPAFSALEGHGDREKLVQTLLRAGWLLTLLMVAVQSTLTVFAPDVLRLYMGHAMGAEVVQVLRISAFVAVISAPSLVVLQYVFGIGGTRWIAAMAISSGLINFSGGLILVPRLGLAGAAWSDLIAIVGTRPLIHYFIWRRHLSDVVTAKVFFRRLYGASLVGIPLTLALTVAREQVPEWQPGWISLPLGAAGVAIFVIGAVLVVELLRPNPSQGLADIRMLFRRLILKLAR